MGVEGLEAIVQTGRLPSPPATAMRVVELCEDPDVDVEDIAEVVNQDPALAAKLLRTANSSLFAYAGRVASIDRALLRLGLAPSRLLVLTFSLVDHYRHSNDLGLDYDYYWHRAVVGSLVARQVAGEHLAALADMAVVGALLTDIGMLAMAECEPKRYWNAWSLQERTQRPIHELEQEIFDTTHAEVGGYLLGRWNLPMSLVMAITHHTHPGTLSASEQVLLPLVRCLHLSEQIADLVVGERGPQAAAAVAALAAEYFGYDADSMGELLGRMAAESGEAADSLIVNDFGSLDAARLLARARELLTSGPPLPDERTG